MPQGDKTGPKGKGPETGRGVGYASSNTPGSQKEASRPKDGRGDGRGYRPIRNTSTQYNGKNGTPLLKRDSSGPPTGGKKKGPGKGRQDGSGLEDIVTKTEVTILNTPKAYDLISKEYKSVYSQNEKSYSSSSDLKKTITQAHNDAIKKGYHGNKRRDYVRKEVKKRSNAKTSKKAA